MRVFQSISGHSSELSIANHSSRPTVSQLKCVSDIISNWFKNHQPQKTKISAVANAYISFRTRIKWPLGTATTSFPRVFFQLLQYLTQRPSFSTHRAALMTILDLIFPAFSLKFVDFAAQFCFRCKFLFHKETLAQLPGLTVAWFSWTNHNSLLRIASNEITSFCIDNRLRQMAFLVFAKVGKAGAKAGFRVIMKYLEIKKALSFCVPLFCSYHVNMKSICYWINLRLIE